MKSRIISQVGAVLLLAAVISCEDAVTEMPGATPEAVFIAPETEAEPVFAITEPIPETTRTEETTAPPPSVIAPEEILLPFGEVVLPSGGQITPAVRILPADAEETALIWTSGDPSVAEVDAEGNLIARGEGNCRVTVSVGGDASVSASVRVTVGAADSCTCIDGVLIVNKTYALPKSWAPGIDAQAFAALSDMFRAAAAAGHTLRVKSSYRSYMDQYVIYKGYAAADGKEAADRYSARAGHSEHQSGLAFDLNELTFAFGESPAGIWLAENCFRYGFIIRYPKDKESVTGYMYEPWHVRYVGEELAEKLTAGGLCLEEYFGITSAYGKDA